MTPIEISKHFIIALNKAYLFLQNRAKQRKCSIVFLKRFQLETEMTQNKQNAKRNVIAHNVKPKSIQGIGNKIQIP